MTKSNVPEAIMRNPQEVTSIVKSIFRLLSQEVVTVSLPETHLCQPLILWQRADEFLETSLVAWTNPLDGGLTDLLLELKPVFPTYWFPEQLKHVRDAYLWLIYNVTWSLYDDQDNVVSGCRKEDSSDRAIKHTLWTLDPGETKNLCLEFVVGKPVLA